jgi:cytochrome b involved in lipid metabolism
MEPLLIAAVGLAVVLVVLLILKKQSTYKGHVQQLQHQKEKRKLVVGRWTREEVAKHRAADDLWLIIRDKASNEARVYDLTEYVEEHPGGMAIMFNAGGDATQGFHGPQHPETVHELVKEYYIGTLLD